MAREKSLERLYICQITSKNGEKIYYNCLTTLINSENYLLKNERIKKYQIANLYPWY
jgi:hypothetical protein